MQGLFNKQQRFITSLFPNGVFSKNDIITVCYRRVVTSSRSALHHGKGITYKLQGGRGSGCGPNARFPRPSSSKFHKKSCWLKKPKSRKSCGSSCTVTKSRKGKIIFRITRTPLPKVIPDERTNKPSSTFKNSINKVFESKIVRARKSRNGFNDAKSPVDKLSLPDFKDTSIVSTGHKKTSKNSFVKKIQKSRSAESQYIVKQNQVVESEKISTPEKSKRIDSYSKQFGIKDKTKLSCKSNKDAPKVSPNPRKLRKAKSRPLNFSSSEMLYPNADNSIKLGADKIKKSDSSFKKYEERREGVDSGVKVVNNGDTVEASVEENALIQPLDENVDSTINLFIGTDSKSVSKKIGASFSETVNNLLKLGNDGTALGSECAGRLDLQAIQLDKNIDIRALDTKTELGKVENSRDDVGKSDCFNQSTLFSKIETGDTNDGLNKAPQNTSQVTSKAERSTLTTRNVKTLKRGDNITLHKYVDLKRPIRQEIVEFDTTVIEQKGRRITKIKPKHDFNLRNKESNWSLTQNKNKMYDNRSSNKPCKSPGSTRVESYVISTLPKTKDTVLDNVTIIPPDGKKITQFENNQKMNLQIKKETVVIPQDGRKIMGDYDWSNKGRSNTQVGDTAKQDLKSAGFVLPQQGNTNRKLEAKIDPFNLRSESKTNNNVNKKHPGDTGRSQNDMKHQYRDDGVLNQKKIEDELLKESRNQIQRKEASQNKPSDIKHIGDNSMFDNSVGVNKHVFVNKNLNSKGNVPSDYRSNLKDTTEWKEPKLGKISPKSVDDKTTKQDVLKSLTQKMSANRISRTEELKVERTVPDTQTAVKPVSETSSESSAPIQNASTSSTKKSWRSLLPFYSSNSKDQQKTVDEQPLQSAFPGNFTAARENPGVEDAQWSRKVTKMKFHPQSGSDPAQTQNSLTNSFPGQGIQASAEPKIAATSDTATAIVLKSRLAQNPPESVRINPPQSPSIPNTFSQSAYSGSSTTSVRAKAPDQLAIPANVITSGFQLGPLANERVDVIYPSNSSFAVGTQPAGRLSMINKTESYSVNSGISDANAGYPSNSGCNMPKASFPPPCNSCQNATLIPSGNLASDSCNMPKAVFPPPCNTCQNSPLMLTGNQSSSSSDGCKSVFPPPCEAPLSHQPDSFSCPTCKPEFPPPCQPNNPCSSPQRADNTCYDPCKSVTKSKTHTILDISNLPRPPTPICIDCVPKKKPCFPPECPQQCKNTTSTCLNNAKAEEISFASWRAFANYTYWSMKCLLNRLFENFLTILKARIQHVSEFKKKSICEQPVHPQGCVMESSVIRPRKTNYKVSISKSHDIVNSKLQKVKPRTTNRVRKKSRVVKSVKKSVLDERSKRAISAEQEKRRTVGAKAPPALAYSEVLNIVFSQKK